MFFCHIQQITDIRNVILILFKQTPHYTHFDGAISYRLLRTHGQNRWEADSHLAGSKRKPKFHYRVHRSPSLVPVLSQLYPIQSFRTCFLNIHCNVIFRLHLCLPTVLNIYSLCDMIWRQMTPACSVLVERKLNWVNSVPSGSSFLSFSRFTKTNPLNEHGACACCTATERNVVPQIFRKTKRFIVTAFPFLVSLGCILRYGTAALDMAVHGTRTVSNLSTETVVWRVPPHFNSRLVLRCVSVYSERFVLSNKAGRTSSRMSA
jgi:hypothetical protein